MRRWLLATLLLAGACKSSETKSDPTPVAPALGKSVAAKDGAPTAPAATRRGLRFKVDGKHVEVTGTSDNFALLELTGLPPVQEWKTLIVRNLEGREFTGTNPLLLTGIRTMRVVHQPDGAFEFRVMEQVRGNDDAGPKPDRIRHKMPNAKSIIIQTKGYVPPAPPAVLATLSFAAGDAKVELDRATMDAIERDAEPGAREARDTWELITLLKAAKLEPTRSIRFTNQQGKTLELTSEEFQSNESAHIIKRNRRGQFNYRRWSLETPPKRVGELRGVVSIELLMK